MLQQVKLFLSRLKRQSTCEKQETQLSIKTDICKACFKPIEYNSLHRFINKNVSICHKCYLEFKPKFKKFSVDGCEVLSIYNYDSIIKEKLYQFKGCFDYELAPIFLEYQRPYLRIKYHGYNIIPAPSFFEHDEKRGFNHVIEIFKLLNLNLINCFRKIVDVKQSDLSSKERANIINYLVIDGNPNIKGKKILIVDDVFTTGSTVKAMIKMLRKYNPKVIKVLVLSRSTTLD